ncbi:ABC transporter ATP-binding protein [Rhodovulum sp. DZ06]|uniref:ABC transporter ATP-binding protein n=1 Tax=Rhodovulum sp. DZ06 TaxID=3425126 RepID=UPI003D32E1AD
MTLTLQDLSAGYGRIPVIRNVSETWPAGALTALIGCNGAGKSTLLRAVAGLAPATGRVTLDGVDAPPAARAEAVAYMPQDTGAASSLTVLEVVLLGRLRSLGLRLPPEAVGAGLEALEDFGLAHLAAARIDEISGGQRQLVFLAQALLRAPRALLLDEPTAALDLRHQLLVLERLRDLAARSGTVVVMAVHDLNLAAQFADRICALHAGGICAAGRPGAVLTPGRLREMYGIEAEVRRGAGGLQVIPLRAADPRGAAA